MDHGVGLEPSKRYLFSIHGMSKVSDWQDGVASVLSPYYEYRVLRYGQFERWPILKLAPDVIAALCFAFGGALLWRLRVLDSVWRWEMYWATAMVVFLVAHFCARSFREKVIDQVHLDVTSATSNDAEPSVVAHSLGSFLLCSALAKFGDMTLKTVILDGCVVSARYPWPEEQFYRAYNEMGGGDRVPYAAALLSGTVRWMGWAGARGFRGAPVDKAAIDPQLERYRCAGENKICCALHFPTGVGCASKVHNVVHEHLPHSGYHSGVNHAWRFWIPRLWDFDPELYRGFRETCHAYMHSSAGGVEVEFEEIAETLDRTCFGWTRGPFRDHVKKQVLKLETRPSDGKEIDDMVNIAIWYACDLFVRATIESRKTSGRDERLMRSLDPRVAVRNGIAAVVRLRQDRSSGLQDRS